MEQALLGVERFMYVGNHLGAEQTSLTVSRLGILLGEIQAGMKPFSSCRSEIEGLLEELEVHWARESALMNKPTEPAEPPAPEAPQTKGPARREPENNATFAYIGTPGFPLDEEMARFFLEELPEHLYKAEQAVLALEQHLTAQEPLNELFRTVHTLKGNSAFLGLVEIRDISHAMESMLDSARKGRALLDREKTQILLQGVDLLRKMGINLRRRVDEQTGQQPDHPPQPLDWQPLLVRLRQME
ncbi:MAG: Hpt domain-containing protein [Deltaproteobacteria bacterium]|nr:Hpt domain-containing protein [Deltaproteobacteria bacterium]